eukprot:3966267-Pleurochrysis_carterae.AAC.1
MSESSSSSVLLPSIYSFLTTRRELVVALVDREQTHRVASVPYPILSERGTRQVPSTSRPARRPSTDQLTLVGSHFKSWKLKSAKNSMPK